MSIFPIAQSLYGSSAIVFGREVYGENSNWLIEFTHSLFKKISDVLWWFKYRFIKRHRHHVIELGTAPGYSDDREKILNACMKILCDFIEQQPNVETQCVELRECLENDENCMEVCYRRQLNTLVTAQRIYNWWKIERPADQNRSEELLHEGYNNHKLEFKETDENGFREAIFREPSESEQKAREELNILDIKIICDEQEMLHKLIDIREGLWD